MKLPENELISYCFMDSNGKIIDSRNSQIPFVPASNMKIVTAYMAASTFGLDHDFITGVGIAGDTLFLSGGPMFYLSLPNLIADLLTSQDLKDYDFSRVREIAFLDSSLDDNVYNQSWQIGDIKHSYQPPISSFFIHENCTPRGKVAFLEDDTVIDHHNEELYRSVSDPYRNIAKSVKGLLKLTRLPTIKRMSRNDIRIARYHRVNIGVILAHILRESCNFYAEVMFKSISSEPGKPGSWERSAEIAKNTVSDIKNASLTRFIDGSGLSKDNLLNVIFLADLFRISKARFGERFLNLFPEPGQGTIRNRLLDFKNFQIRAKTGTLSTVSSLSGIIGGLNVTFSISINNSLGSSSEREATIDGILGEFITSGHLSAETN